MPAADPGICPHCERRMGRVGEACPGEGCAGRYRFIPKPWFDAARDFAHRKGRPLDPLLGRVLDRYLLAGKLGEGGMGAVYLAFQQPLGREVALKLISGLEMTETAKARFEREARAISVLDHPNIVKLYDYGIGRLEFEVPYMALEYVRHGRTLRHALAEIRQKTGGRIPGNVVLTIFEQVLHALGAAHDLGIVHRDMKPDNVMIASVHGNPTFVKVLDFGLAKALQEVSGFDGTVSHTGQFLGTPYYMAPEQATKKAPSPVDGRTDLYAVAVMLFEVFTGVPPFEGGTALEILAKKVDPRFWPLDSLEARALPGPLRAFLDRGLQPRPERRFQTAAEMLRDLQAALAGRRTTAVGMDLRGAGSSQDRPATPPSPRSDSRAREDFEARQFTRPLEGAHGPDWIAEGEPSAEAARKARVSRAWRWVALPVVLVVFGGGLWFLLGSGAREAGSGTTATPVAVPEAPPAPAEPAQPPPATAGEGAQPEGHPAPAALPAEAPSVAKVVPAPSPPTAQSLFFEVRTSPPGAVVLVEGAILGPSPARYAFEAKTDQDLDRVVEVVARHKGYREAVRAVRLKDAVASGGVDLALKRLPRRTPAARPEPAPAKKKFQLK